MEIIAVLLLSCLVKRRANILSLCEDMLTCVQLYAAG